MADPLFDSIDDRRNFLRAILEKAGGQIAAETEKQVVRKQYVRPPGAVDEMMFLASCTRCGQCSEACPHDVISTVPARGGLAAGTPVVALTSVPCEVCVDIPCANSCPTGALKPQVAGWKAHKLGRIAFEPERCITFEGHLCTVCVDACPVGETALALDSGGHPVLKAAGCVACGHCVRDCVTSPSCFTFFPPES